MPFLPEGEGLTVTGLIFMTLVYGFILLKAAQCIGEGSEMLLTVFGPGVVGGIVIPLFGAIPDGMIILFSGLSGGTRLEMLAELEIGLGTLAGSTVCLLTVPWAITIFLGRRDLDPITGKAQWKFVDNVKVPKCDNKFSLLHSGITVTKSTANSVWVMCGTSMCYLVIQVPAFIWSSLSLEEQANNEQVPALIGLIVSLFALVGYFIYQLKSSTADENTKRMAEEARVRRWQRHFGSTIGQFDNVIKETFIRMDLDYSGDLDIKELGVGLKLLGLDISNDKLLRTVMAKMDEDGSGKISLVEFRKAVRLWMHCDNRALNLPTYLRRLSSQFQENRRLSSDRTPQQDTNYQADSMDQLEFPRPRGSRESQVFDFVCNVLHEREPLLGDSYQDEFEANMKDEGSEKHVLRKASLYLIIGLGVVLLFSDPMVSVLSNLSAKIGVGSFYVSFVVTPLASNASEIVTALYFAASKTETKVSMSHASLYGAACMNNTFCLAIFLFLIYYNDLPWNFSAETMCILLSELAIALLAYKRTIPLWKAVVGLLIYPIAILFVIFCDQASKGSIW